MFGSAETTVIASPNLYPFSQNQEIHTCSYIFDPNPIGTRIICANAPKSIWNTYSKRKCHAARRPASQPASQPPSLHKNLDFRGCPGPLAKPTQINPLGAFLGPPILYCFGGCPCLPAKPTQIDLLGRLSGHSEQILIWSPFGGSPA